MSTLYKIRFFKEMIIQDENSNELKVIKGMELFLRQHINYTYVICTPLGIMNITQRALDILVDNELAVYIKVSDKSLNNIETQSLMVAVRLNTPIISSEVPKDIFYLNSTEGIKYANFPLKELV